MKRLKILFIISLFVGLSAQAISPFYNAGVKSNDFQSNVSEIKHILKQNGFDVIGEYHPGKVADWYVIAYTSDDLKRLCFGMDDRAALAATLKLGLIKKKAGWQLFVQNPDYLFNAVFREQMKDGITKSAASKIAKKINANFKDFGPSFEPFGGDVKATKLWEYHYMFGMPYFSDPVELQEFDSFEAGLALIRKNIVKGTGNTVGVFELIDASKKIAVFGVGLLDAEKGEASFLKIIGSDHLAAMPYEIILEGKKATMLHGRFRFALNWPELTMGTFTKIMSTPGNVETVLESLTK